jgi:hypothetical protein
MRIVTPRSSNATSVRRVRVLPRSNSTSTRALYSGGPAPFSSSNPVPSQSRWSPRTLSTGFGRRPAVMTLALAMLRPARAAIRSRFLSSASATAASNVSRWVVVGAGEGKDCPATTAGAGTRTTRSSGRRTCTGIGSSARVPYGRTLKMRSLSAPLPTACSRFAECSRGARVFCMDGTPDTTGRHDSQIGSATAAGWPPPCTQDPFGP